MKNLSENLKIKVILWSPIKYLHWGDFKKNPDLKSRASANSAIGFESEPIVGYVENGGKFKFKILDMQLRAIFIPEFSWVKKNILNKYRKPLLTHEQGHFDLVEEIVRGSKINAHFSGLLFDVKGKNKTIAEKNVILQVTDIRKKVESKLEKKLKREETTYDDKTNYGLIKLQQEKYNKRFKKLR